VQRAATAQSAPGQSAGVWRSAAAQLAVLMGAD
jgi:hypothetical protein